MVVAFVVERVGEEDRETFLDTLDNGFVWEYQGVTMRRPSDAPSWWSEESASDDALALMKALGSSPPPGVGAYDGVQPRTD